jgi:hypothetical protein
MVLLWNGLLLIISRNTMERKKQRINLKVYLGNKLAVSNQIHMLIDLLVLSRNIS